MGISSALYTGVSGLNTNGNAMNVIGNNLANTNTIAYKGSRTVFSDLLSATVTGSGGSSQVGRGVGLSTVDNIFSQGTFETTESGLDLAIEGDSFFLVSSSEEDTTYYTRAGAFNFDDDGYLVNPEGLRVQGISYNTDNELIGGDPQDIYLDNEGLIQGNPTSEITLNTNLDANADIIISDSTDPDYVAFDYTDSSTFTYSSSTQIYDSLGNPHLLTTYFTKTDDNEWQARYSAEDADGNPLPGDTTAIPVTTPNDQTPEDIYFGVNGELVDSTGTVLSDPQTYSIAGFDWANGSDIVDIEIELDMTQFNSDSVVISQDQNGYGAGSLSGVGLDESGNVIASYSNGEKRYVAGVSLAKFLDPSALSMEGNNLFAATLESGAPRVGLPDAELGSIFSYSLEMSNVDVAAEMVDMITTQRGYQANSKIITAVDELLEEVINLKR